jgi:beta-glucosidase-like glycosyl hydrolase
MGVIITDAAQLWLDVGLAIGTESRALYNEGAGHVWLFAPNINLIRDPRWGRAQEVPGEDATLVSAYAAAFVRGIQAKPLPRKHACNVTLFDCHHLTLNAFKGPRRCRS